MTHSLTVTLPDDLYRQLQRQAQVVNRPVSEVAVTACVFDASHPVETGWLFCCSKLFSRSLAGPLPRRTAPYRRRLPPFPVQQSRRRAVQSPASPGLEGGGSGRCDCPADGLLRRVGQRLAKAHLAGIACGQCISQPGRYQERTTA